MNAPRFPCPKCGHKVAPERFVSEQNCCSLCAEQPSTEVGALQGLLVIGTVVGAFVLITPSSRAWVGKCLKTAIRNPGLVLTFAVMIAIGLALRLGRAWIKKWMFDSTFGSDYEA